MSKISDIAKNSKNQQSIDYVIGEELENIKESLKDIKNEIKELKGNVKETNNLILNPSNGMSIRLSMVEKSKNNFVKLLWLFVTSSIGILITKLFILK